MLKFILFFFLTTSSSFAADLIITKKFNDNTLNKVASEFNKLSPSKSALKISILKREKGESSIEIIKQITLLNFKVNKILSDTIDVQELKFSNEILVALSSMFTNIYDVGEGQIETSSLSKFEAFLVDHLVNSSYRLFSSWSDAQLNACYGFYIESKKTKEVLALGSCF